VLFVDLEPYWLAFWELSNQRKGELSSQPLQLTEILAYCELTQVDDRYERERLMRAVLLLDREWRKATRVNE